MYVVVPQSDVDCDFPILTFFDVSFGVLRYAVPRVINLASMRHVFILRQVTVNLS